MEGHSAPGRENLFLAIARTSWPLTNTRTEDGVGSGEGEGEDEKEEWGREGGQGEFNY